MNGVLRNELDGWGGEEGKNRRRSGWGWGWGWKEVRGARRGRQPTGLEAYPTRDLGGVWVLEVGGGVGFGC